MRNSRYSSVPTVYHVTGGCNRRNRGRKIFKTGKSSIFEPNPSQVIRDQTGTALNVLNAGRADTDAKQ